MALDRFSGQVALVTGAARGIGETVARRLAGQGAAVALLDMDQAGLAEVRAGIGRAGGRARAYPANVASEEEVGRALAQVELELGLVTMAVTCAGIIKIVPFLDLSAENWQRTLSVNLVGTFTVFKHVARRLVAAQQPGRLVGLSSVSGRGGRADSADYAASKAGVISLVRSAALALAPYGITVNAVCPGVVDTPMTRQLHAERARLAGQSVEESLAGMVARIPLGRMQSPDDVADAVLFFLSKEGGYITGQALNSCGGLEMD